MGGGMMYNLMERLVVSKGSCWDYCVLWKLSEDHRFLEWFDCSCVGTHWNHHHHHHENRTEEDEDVDFSTSAPDYSSGSAAVVPCKDVMVQHPRRDSCDLLAQLPSSLPMDGINAEVLMSNEPRWMNYIKSSSSSSSDSINEHGGRVETKVLIPVPGGLIELFAAKQVTEDQTVVDFILTQFDSTVFLQQEPTITDQQQEPPNLSTIAATNNMNTTTDEINSTNNPSSYYNVNQGPNNLHQHHNSINSSSSTYSPSTALESLNLSTSTCEATADRIRICNSAMNFLQQFNYLAAENRTTTLPNNNDDQIYQQPDGQTTVNSIGSFGIADEMEKSMSAAVNHDMGVTHESEQQLGGGDDQRGTSGLKNELVGGSRVGVADSLSDSDQLLDVDEEDSKGGGGGGGSSSRRSRSSNGKGQSKNLVAERKRRKKLNERLYNLRSLVPKISKLDRASILGDAIEYVMELKQQAKELEDELEQNSEEEMMMEEEDGNGSSGLLIGGGNNNPGMEFGGNPVQIGVKFGGMEFDHDKSSNGYCVGSGGGGLKRSRSDTVTGESSNNNNNDKTQQMEVQVEVAQLEGNEYFIKVFGEQKRGGFVRLLEALTSLGLEIINVNVTSCISLVSYVFIVEKIDSEIVQAEYLRDSLLEVTRNPAAAAAAAVAAGEWSAAAMAGPAPPPETGIEQQHFQYHQQLYGSGGSNHGGIGLHHLHHHHFHPFNN